VVELGDDDNRSVALAISSLISYLLVTAHLPHAYSRSTADDLISGI
jgi:hypothetical protein